MTRPRKYLIRMTAFVIAVFVICGALFQPLYVAFVTNAPLNGVILGVLLLGIVYNFRQVLLLYPEVEWIENFRSASAPLSESASPRLLAPMAAMVGSRAGSPIEAWGSRASAGVWERLPRSEGGEPRVDAGGPAVARASRPSFAPLDATVAARSSRPGYAETLALVG